MHPARSLYTSLLMLHAVTMQVCTMLDACVHVNVCMCVWCRYARSWMHVCTSIVQLLHCWYIRCTVSTRVPWVRVIQGDTLRSSPSPSLSLSLSLSLFLSFVFCRLFFHAVSQIGFVRDTPTLLCRSSACGLFLPACLYLFLPACLYKLVKCMRPVPTCMPVQTCFSPTCNFIISSPPICPAPSHTQTNSTGG